MIYAFHLSPLLWLPSRSSLCLVSYGSRGKHHRMTGGSHLLYMQSPPWEFAEARTCIPVNHAEGEVWIFSILSGCCMWFCKQRVGKRKRSTIKDEYTDKCITFWKGQSDPSWCWWFTVPPAEGKYCTQWQLCQWDNTIYAYTLLCVCVHSILMSIYSLCVFCSCVFACSWNPFCSV